MASPAALVSLVSLLALLGCARVINAQADISVWDPVNANAATWVDYPVEFEPRLEGEKEAFVVDKTKRKVNVRVYQIFPEPEEEPNLPSQRVFPILQGIVQRMDGVLWPRVSYYLKKGEDFQCFLEGNPVRSDHCNRHCTHQGRYCAPQVEEELRPGRLGKDVVEEILRRLCLDQDFHEPSTFASYLQEYDIQDCFGKDTAEQVRECSYQAMVKVGVDPDSLKACAESPQDQEHPLLEENWHHFHKFAMTYHKSDMPQIDVDGRGIMPKDYARDIREWTSSLIFQTYCDAFPYCETAVNKGKPLACQICSGCSNVETCLWTLQCDGKPLDIGEILASARPFSDQVQPEYACGDKIPPPVLVDTDAPIQVQTTQQSSNNNDRDRKNKSNAGVYFRIVMAGVVMLAVGLTVVYCYRKRQAAERRKAKILERSIPQEKMYSDYNDEPSGIMDRSSSSTSSNPPGISFTEFGRASVSKGNLETNMAPRPHEDQMHDLNELVVFDDIGSDLEPEDGGSSDVFV